MQPVVEGSAGGGEWQAEQLTKFFLSVNRPSWVGRSRGSTRRRVSVAMRKSPLVAS